MMMMRESWRFVGMSVQRFMSCRFTRRRSFRFLSSSPRGSVLLPRCSRYSPISIRSRWDSSRKRYLQFHILELIISRVVSVVSIDFAMIFVCQLSLIHVVVGRHEDHRSRKSLIDEVLAWRSVAKCR